LDLCEFLTLIGSYFWSGLSNCSCAIEYKEVQGFVIHLKPDVTPYVLSMYLTCWGVFMTCQQNILYEYNIFKMLFMGIWDTLCQKLFTVCFTKCLKLNTSFLKRLYKKDATTSKKIHLITCVLTQTIWASCFKRCSVIVNFVTTHNCKEKTKHKYVEIIYSL